MQDEIRQVREFSSVWPDRPRVYFEEWGDPPIAGIRWVSELIEVAGGQDVFPELRDRRDARGRIVDPVEVVRRDPEIVVASWCGKPVDLEAIRGRPGVERDLGRPDGSPLCPAVGGPPVPGAFGDPGASGPSTSWSRPA